eukprot:CAMPEP_0181205388 /NCGR_PEP_ID=MMETSP1096-20121128/20448_1 /TAXON_ID=156174 ORGANISM="Chrysochromulina ericina, Strain CCMP281" /NCGR_SAMPLE_ID=MMETSP1096 /ASSEMBLY_ACC=CAM_ASM_000453 /LENGTH=260 /DNA_ID=CAMNT_0023296163 /DNA_START=590 /DNA_END=1374 /DNA_ORIENTATION=-
MTPSMTPRHAILDVNHEVFPALLVLYGDVGVFVGNGVVQSAADTLLLPLAASQPELFTQSQVLSAQWQGIALAALWAGFTMALNGYRPSTTRTLPSRPAFIPSAPPGSDRASFSFPRVQGLAPLEAEGNHVTSCLHVMRGTLLNAHVPPPYAKSHRHSAKASGCCHQPFGCCHQPLGIDHRVTSAPHSQATAWVLAQPGCAAPPKDKSTLEACQDGNSEGWQLPVTGLGLPLEAETEFVFGSATVVGGWRLLYSGGLPLV